MHMTQHRFRKIIQAYGSKPHNWPPQERRAAEKFAQAHPALCADIIAAQTKLDALLDMAVKPQMDTTLLAARILKTAKNTAQDHLATEANDHPLQPNKTSMPTPWKSIAATLVLTTGMGFGLGQAAAANTSFDTAQSLLSLSMQDGYNEDELSNLFQGEMP